MLVDVSEVIVVVVVVVVLTMAKGEREAKMLSEPSEWLSEGGVGEIKLIYRFYLLFFLSHLQHTKGKIRLEFYLGRSARTLQHHHTDHPTPFLIVILFTLLSANPLSDS